MVSSWPEDPGNPNWGDSSVTRKILGGNGGKGMPIPVEWVRHCYQRIGEMRNHLRKLWIGLDLGDGRGYLTDWALACLIARENLLLLGPPGVAKTEIAEHIFKFHQLQTPKVEYALPALPADTQDLGKWWLQREAEEGSKHKFFRYLLSRFTQPEELFGPVEINLLRRGMLVHVNFGLLTSPGVRAAFLDEIFKASSSILNTLLTLVLEREYFNWGGMRRSDLVMFIGASNELPGGLATGHTGIGTGGEDFNLLYAFLDRFPLRLEVPNVSGTSTTASGTSAAAPPVESDLARATKIALQRERVRFNTGEPFDDLVWSGAKPCVNDTLLLGRALMEAALNPATKGSGIFDTAVLDRFKERFYKIGANLQQQGTGLREGSITWTISPRKLKALFKIALAHTLISDDQFAGKGRVLAGPGPSQLHVFDFIWDTPMARDELLSTVRASVGSW